MAKRKIAAFQKKAVKITAAPPPPTPGKRGKTEKTIAIRPPKFAKATLLIEGTAPYVGHAFAAKSVNTMIRIQQEGQQARKGKVREAKNFKEVYEQAKHISKQGWLGIPAAAFRNAMISACRTVGFKMTLAKLSVFVEADGFDKNSGDPLVKITKGKPHPDYRPAKNSNGSTDIRCRPMWDAGWQAKVTMRWDEDQFSPADILNLLNRVGMQVGVGEGRADSRDSAGIGWGHFRVKN